MPKRKVNAERLKELYVSGVPLAEIARRLGVHLSTVHYWRRKLGLRRGSGGGRGRRWTKKELDFIKSNASKLTDKEMARCLGRTAEAVKFKRLRLGIRRQRRVDKELFKNLYRQGLTAREIAEKLNVDIKTVYLWGTKLGLRFSHPLKKQAESRKKLVLKTLNKVGCVTLDELSRELGIEKRLVAESLRRLRREGKVKSVKLGWGTRGSKKYRAHELFDGAVGRHELMYWFTNEYFLVDRLVPILPKNPSKGLWLAVRRCLRDFKLSKEAIDFIRYKLRR